MADEKAPERRSALRLALGAAGVVIIVAVYLGLDRDRSGSPIETFDFVERAAPIDDGGDGIGGGASLGLTSPVPGTDAVTLRWPASSAGSYTLVLMTPEYHELARLGPFETSSASISLASLPPAAHAHAAVFWSVIDGEATRRREAVGAIVWP